MLQINIDRTVVIPKRPAIDEAIASNFVIRAHPQHRFRVDFCDVNWPTPAQRKAFDRGVPGSAILVDLAEGKWHNRFKSSAEEHSKRFSKPHPVVDELVKLANENNQTGMLKSGPHSIAYAMREIPWLYDDELAPQQFIWAMVMDTINAFFWPEARSWDDLAKFPRLHEMWKAFRVRDENFLKPFQLPLYFQQMFLAGRRESDIVEHIEWWLENLNDVREEIQAAEEEEFEYDEFFVHGIPAGVVHIEDHWQGKAAPKVLFETPDDLGLLVLRNPNGQATVLCSHFHQYDLAGVYQELGKEPGRRWYYQKKTGALINGGPQASGTPATSLTDGQLMKLLASKARYLGRKSRKEDAAPTRPIATVGDFVDPS